MGQRLDHPAAQARVHLDEIVMRLLENINDELNRVVDRWWYASDAHEALDLPRALFGNRHLTLRTLAHLLDVRTALPNDGARSHVGHAEA
eukprot:scaffold25466_cov34-Tisochrysis_lutea.AAC.4